MNYCYRKGIQVVLFSKGPLLEVPLTYTCACTCTFTFTCTCMYMYMHMHMYMHIHMHMYMYRAVASSDACHTCGHPDQLVLKKCSRCKKVRMLAVAKILYLRPQLYIFGGRRGIAVCRVSS